MVSPYPGNTYKLRGGGRGGVSVSGTVLHGAVFGRAPPHPLGTPTVPHADFTATSPTELIAMASVSL